MFEAFSMTPEQHYIDAWRKAASVMDAYKTEKLRTLSPDRGAMMLGVGSTDSEPFYSHGLARWQGWMMRWRLLNASEITDSAGGE